MKLLITDSCGNEIDMNSFSTYDRELIEKGKFAGLSAIMVAYDTDTHKPYITGMGMTRSYLNPIGSDQIMIVALKEV